MGSGRGRTRRAQATTTTARASIMVEKWQDFVEEQAITNTRLADYYGVSFKKSSIAASPNPGNMPKHDLWRAQEQMATEFFRDLVELGAFIFPPGVSVDDISFKVEERNAYQGSSQTYEALTLVREEKRTSSAGFGTEIITHEAQVQWYPGQVLREQSKASNRQFVKLIRKINTAFNHTLDAAKS